MTTIRPLAIVQHRHYLNEGRVGRVLSVQESDYGTTQLCIEPIVPDTWWNSARVQILGPDGSRTDVTRENASEIRPGTVVHHVNRFAGRVASTRPQQDGTVELEIETIEPGTRWDADRVRVVAYVP